MHLCNTLAYAISYCKQWKSKNQKRRRLFFFFFAFWIDDNLPKLVHETNYDPSVEMSVIFKYAMYLYSKQ